MYDCISIIYLGIAFTVVEHSEPLHAICWRHSGCAMKASCVRAGGIYRPVCNDRPSLCTRHGQQGKLCLGPLCVVEFPPTCISALRLLLPPHQFISLGGVGYLPVTACPLFLRRHAQIKSASLTAREPPIPFCQRVRPGKNNIAPGTL
jgi:hypothetical protein